ncbi:MAG: hypothetical protein KDD33_12425, partial [Bdellovibrionales bacterium]|nr:hypothetical protein [Bdellovibrionales bacterium]
IDSFSLQLTSGFDEEWNMTGRLKGRRHAGELLLSVEPKELSLRGKKIPIRSTEVSFRANRDRMELVSQSFVREGKIQIEAQLQREESHQLDFKASVVELPVSTFSFLYSDNLQVGYLWLSCDFHLSSPLLDADKTLIQMGDNCQLNGPYGSARLQSSKVSLEKVEQLQVVFDKINLDQLIKSKRGVFLSGIFSAYGIFSGLLELDPEGWKMEGLLEASEVLFSRNNRREVQPLEKIPMVLIGNKTQWQGKIENVVLSGGEFQGNISGEWNEASVKAQVSMHRLLLNKNVYGLMTLSEPFPFSLYGKLELKNKKLQNWGFVLAAAEVKGQGFEFSGLKVEAAQEGEGPAHILWKVPSGSFDGKLSLVNWLKPTTTESEFTPDFFHWKEMSVKFSLDPNKNLQWQRGYLRLANNWQLSTEGQWSADGETQGWLQWDRADKKIWKWSYAGRLLKGQWTPTSEPLKKWLEGHPEYLADHPSIQFEPLEPKNFGGEMKEVGKKIIEKAKSVLPIEKKPAEEGS